MAFIFLMLTLCPRQKGRKERAEQSAAADRAAITAFRGATALPAARLLSFGVRAENGSSMSVIA
jgi:hypothetical protein